MSMFAKSSFTKLQHRPVLLVCFCVGLMCAASAVVINSAHADSIAVEFDNTDILEFVRYARDVTGLTIVVDPRVKGQVTVHSPKPLSKSEFYQLFLQVLNVNGFTAVNNNNVVSIIPLTEARTAPIPTQ